MITFPLFSVRSIVALSLACASSLAQAGLDDTEKLEGKAVIYAGEIEQQDCPPFGKYDCLRWPTGLYKFRHRDVCFQSHWLLCTLGCSAILAADRHENLTLFHIDRDKLTSVQFQLHQCPTS